jgi:hypothetical protein
VIAASRRPQVALVLAVVLAAGCAPDRAPTPLPQPSRSEGSPGVTLVPVAGAPRPMDNLGLEVTFTERWVAPDALTQQQAGTLQALDPETVQVVTDGWQELREQRGGDLGALMVDPSTAMLFVARWVDEDDQERDLPGVMTAVAGRQPRADELETVQFLGRDALRAVLRETVQGAPRVRLFLVSRLADGRAAVFSATGPAGTFDLAAADAVIASIADRGQAAAGKPWHEVRDPLLEDQLASLGYDRLVSGDLWTLIRTGGTQGSVLFRAAVTNHPTARSDPDRVRGARTGPSEPPATGFAEVSAIRIDGEPEAEAQWGVIDGGLVELGYGPGRTGSCEGLVANPTTDGHAGALVVAGGAAYLFEGPDMASVIAVAGKAIAC